MTDFHNHFTSTSSILCTSSLLPQYYTEEIWEEMKREKPHHLGEAGLDKRYVSLVPLEEQKRRLTDILTFAKNNGLCVTLHSVRTTSHTLEVLSRVQPFERTVIWHGFTGSCETASILYKMGVIISIGPRVPEEKIKTLVQANPLFVLETDYDGNSYSEHEQLIKEVYNRASKALGITEERLEEMCLETAAAFKI